MFIVLVGPPGAGKGIQGERLSKHLDAPWLSTGDMLRSAQHAQTPLGREAQGFLEKGDLVPDPIVIGIVSDRLEVGDCDDGCLFDGFPRTIAQAEALDELLLHRDTPLDLALELRVDDEIILERLSGRNREDDTLNTIANRLRVYASRTKPVLDYYGTENNLCTVDGVGSVDEVFRRILKCINDHQPRNK